jgi:alanyl-tRNA synthetase
MGLERVAAVLQGKLSNYETDLLWPIIENAAKVLGTEYGESDRVATTLRICADHARATAFLINDGVMPSNEGRGYVLRKIMRRAMRNARMIGKQDPFLHEVTRFVGEYMAPAYPDMLESRDRVSRVVREEELRYANTFQVAERVFHDEAKTAHGGVLSGPCGVQAVRHVRSRARRAGRHGPRLRSADRSRRVRGRDGPPA